MLAKWVRDIRGIDGWDFFARLLEMWGMVTSMPMVVAWEGDGVTRSMATSRGRFVGCCGRRLVVLVARH